jgi:DNA primase
MRDWLEAKLKKLSLSEESEGYLLGRGAQEHTLKRLGVCEWVPFGDPCPNRDFSYRYGQKGEALTDHLVFPVRSPRGKLLGIEARSWREKAIQKFFIEPDFQWNPMWVGLTGSMRKLHESGVVYLVEGVFDLFALDWVVPTNAVVLASGRAGLTKRQADFLERYAREVHIVYDMDAAGRRAVEGHLDEDSGTFKMGLLQSLQKRGISFVSDHKYRAKDPGEIWDAEGVEGLKRHFGGI